MSDVWPFRRRTPLPPPPSQDERLAEAEEALAHSRKVREDLERQVGFLKRLGRGWDRVHEENGFAKLFAEEFRRPR